MKNSKKLLSILMMVGSLAVTTACSKKDDGGGSGILPPGTTPLNCAATNACGGLSGTQAVLISAAGTSTGYYSQIDVAMDIVGNAAQFNPADPKAVIFYQGPAALSGYLRISGTAAAGASGTSVCGAPAGDYYMQTTQVGSMVNATYSGGAISGAGPNGVRIDARVIQGVLYNNQDPLGTSKGSSTNRIFLQLLINAVNGQPCNMAISTI